MITYTSKQNNEQNVPEIVQDFDLFMGGVDPSDTRIRQEENY